MKKIGNKIRELRLQCGLTQEELADRCELTKGYISQLENDLTSPSIATLIDILEALGSSLHIFFSEEEERKIIFKKTDFIEKINEGMKLNWLVPNSQKNLMEPIIVELLGKTHSPEDMPHEGEEFGFVLSGKITIYLGSKKYICKKGESFYYLADKIHFIENRDVETAKFIWISSPPNF